MSMSSVAYGKCGVNGRCRIPKAKLSCISTRTITNWHQNSILIMTPIKLQRMLLTIHHTFILRLRRFQHSHIPRLRLTPLFILQ